MKLKDRWNKFKKRILTTVGLIGISIAAIVAIQLPVDAPSLPIQQIEAKAWQVTNEYVCVVDGLRITIKAGFRCDLASIPDSGVDDLLGIYRDSPTVRRAALIHDALYGSELVTRAKADRILWLICKEDGMQKDKADAVYGWVQAYGDIVWGKHTKKSITENRKFVTVELLK